MTYGGVKVYPPFLNSALDVEMICQLHAPAVLLPGKDNPVSFRYENWWASEPVWRCGEDIVARLPGNTTVIRELWIC
jgi:hypothetical protein